MRKLLDDIENYVSTCSNETYKFSAVEVSRPNGKIERIDFSDQRSRSGNPNNLIDAVLFVKNKCMISDKAYHELSQFVWHVATSEQNENQSKRAQLYFRHLYGAGRKRKGCRGRSKVRRFFSRSHPAPCSFRMQKMELILKISGDGTRTGKHQHVVNMGFSIRPENHLLRTDYPEYFGERLHLIASAEVSEKREDLVKLFDQFVDIEKVQTVLSGLSVTLFYANSCG